MTPIFNLIDKILAECDPSQIWLFGSRARGAREPRSDWDMLVVLPDEADDRLFDPLFAWRLTKESDVRADLFFCRARDYLEDRGVVNTVMFEVANEGVLLYEH